MSEYLKVEGFPDLVRDPNTGAVLNINTHEVEAARERKRKRLLKQEEESKLLDRVTSLEGDISEIKQLLKQIVEKN